MKKNLSCNQLPIEDLVYFETTCMPADGVCSQHTPEWGEFTYSFSGVLEIKNADEHFMVPPQYGIWLPPDTAHSGKTRYESIHSSLYVHIDLCQHLPKETCVLSVSPLVRAILEHFRQLGDSMLPSPENLRLLQVLVDQLGFASRAGTYLPFSQDPLLGCILYSLQANPGDDRSIAELAAAVHTTERTLTRRCQRDLGMPLSEWRQRLRILKSLTMLEASQTVESIALELGYGSSSAFIATFRKLMGITPAEYRKGTLFNDSSEQAFIRGVSNVA